MVKLLVIVPLTCVALIFAACVIALSISPRRPPPLAAIESVSDKIIPVIFYLPAIDKLDVPYASPVAFRRYAGKPGGGWAILIHGSSGSSIVMLPMARALSAAGIAVYAIDIRGHGETGQIGDIDYLGELEDDIAALATLAEREHPGEKRLLIGHSSGGSLTLRIASEPVAGHFDGFLPLSPYVASDFPGNRPNTGGWADVALPRIIAITLLDRLGIHAFDGWPVIAYAVPDVSPTVRTAYYSNRLLENYSFPRDWRPAFDRIVKRTHVLIGADDELFIAADYPDAFKRYAPAIPVEIVPGVGHMGMVVDPSATQAVVAAAKDMIAGR